MHPATSSPSPHQEYFIGLMSGTSLDGVDGVLVHWNADDRLQVLAHAAEPFDTELRTTLLALNQPDGINELHRAALASNTISLRYTRVVQALLKQTGLAAQDITAIGAHGQTVRHQPRLYDEVGYTLQIQNPALLAERTGIAVVADLRSRDVAAGGQGAPLVPAFHQAAFARPAQSTLILNIGGIANLSVLAPVTETCTNKILGFDCGPGNALMDAWCLAHTQMPYDNQGRWAASGSVDAQLLQRMLSEPYFQQPPPKSTGRDLFHWAWLQTCLSQHTRPLQPVDVQATLTALTAHSCAQAILQHGRAADLLLICGGGAMNLELLRQMRQLLPGITIAPTDDFGLPVLEVEAAAFAWLARQCIRGLPGNLPAVTGALGPRVLGAIYPA